MDPLTLSGIAFLVVCLFLIVILKLSNSSSKSQESQQNSNLADSHQLEPSTGVPLPWFDPEPRKEAILAAGRYHWKMKIVYYSTDGTVSSAICSAPQTTRIPRHKITFMNLIISTGENVPLHRIRSIEVQAASEETRRRYRVRDNVSEEVIRAWRDEFAMAIETNREMSITYQDEEGDLTVRTIQPIKLLSANSRPKVRAHCHLADSERHFLIERMLNVKMMPSRDTAETATEKVA